MKSTRFLSRISLIAVLFASSAVFAIEMKTGEDFKFNIRLLIQARAQLSWDGDGPSATNPSQAPAGTLDTDFYIRRGRVYFDGVAFKYFTFYLLLDTPNFGIHGNYTTVKTFTQDIHVGYEPYKDLDIEIGFLYMPLSHLAVNSSAGTLSIEKPTAILLYNNANGLRETGVQARGLLLDRKILLRGGVYEGLRGLQGLDVPGPSASCPTCVAAVVNPHGRPLIAGMARYNFIGYETGYAFPTMYLDGKTRVSVGFGGQYQYKGANTPNKFLNTSGATGNATAVADYLALAGDIFADVALPADTEFMIQADVYHFDWGSGSDKTGYASTVEIGYRFGQIAIEGNGYWFNSESHRGNFLKVAGGLNYFLKGHNAKLQLEFWTQKTNVELDLSQSLKQVTFQAQAYF
jgi:hypothetical protein